MESNDDIRVAEILGWEWEDVRGVKQLRAPLWYWHPNKSQYIVPAFTADPAADYLVLEWVRKTWGEERVKANGEAYSRRPFPLQLFFDYSAALEDIIGVEHDYDYCNPNLTNFRAGDYSRALLELDKKGLLK